MENLFLYHHDANEKQNTNITFSKAIFAVKLMLSYCEVKDVYEVTLGKQTAHQKNMRLPCEDIRSYHKKEYFTQNCTSFLSKSDFCFSMEH